MLSVRAARVSKRLTELSNPEARFLKLPLIFLCYCYSLIFGEENSNEEISSSTVPQTRSLFQ